MKRALAPLLALPVVLGLPMLSGRILLFRDLLHFNIPQQIFAAHARAAGHLPLWDPGRYGGSPFFAEAGTGVLYPGNFLFHLLDPWTAGTAFVIAHLPVAAFGAWLLARELALDDLPSSLAAVGFAGSGYLLSMHGGHYYFASAAWFPLTTALLLRARTPRGVVLAALAVALMILNGELQALLFAGLFACVLAACGAAPRLRSLAWIVAASALGGLLGAVQLVPTLAFVRGTVRASGVRMDEMASWALHPARWIELLVPLPFGIAWPDNASWAAIFVSSVHTQPWAASLYLGPPLILPALCGGLREPRKRALAAIAVLSLLLAAGPLSPLFRIFVAAVPLADRFRYPEKYALPATLALALLGAWGLQDLAKKQGNALRVFGAAAALLAAAAIAALLRPAPLMAAIARGLHLSGANLPPHQALLQLVASLVHAAVLAAALAAALWMARARPAVLLPVFIAAAFVSQVSVGMRVLSWGDAAFLREEPAYVAQARGLGRLMSDGSCVYRGGGTGSLLERIRQWDWWSGKENFPTLFGIREVLGYGAAESRAQVDLFRALLPAGLERAARIFGAGAVLSCRSGEPRVRALDSPLPRLRVVAGCPVEARTLPAALLESDPLKEALVEGPPVAAPGPSAASFLEDDPERITVRAEGPGGLLVLADAMAPGWTAAIDGKPAPIRLADGQWRAVELPAGAHEVRFSYRAPGLIAGAWLTVLGLALCLFLLLRRAARGPVAAAAVGG